jgi:spermidine synthase
MKKINLFRYLWSYFDTLILAEAESEYSQKLQLCYRKGRYMLVSPNAVYSYEDLYFNFSETFARLEAQNWPLKSVLVLGMGLGSVPQLLSQNFKQKNARYTLVEIDPLIIKWAKATTLPQIGAACDIVCADALQFVEHCQTKFDLIAIDIFIDDKVPQIFESQDFIEKIKSLLLPNGRLLFNRLSDTAAQYSLSQTYFQNVFLPAFPQSQALNILTNTMLYGINQQ